MLQKMNVMSMSYVIILIDIQNMCCLHNLKITWNSVTRIKEEMVTNTIRIIYYNIEKVNAKSKNKF